MKCIIILLLGFVLVSSAVSLELNYPDMYDVVEDEPELGDKCSLCKSALNILDPILMPKLEGLVKGALDYVCKISHIPKCSWVAKKLTKYVTKYLKKFLENGKLCKYTKLCGEDMDYYTADDLDMSDEDTSCVKCQLLMKKGQEAIMIEKKVLSEIVMGALDECSQEEGMSEEECRDTLSKFGVTMVDAAIKDFPLLETCSALGKCE